MPTEKELSSEKYRDFTVHFIRKFDIVGNHTEWYTEARWKYPQTDFFYSHTGGASGMFLTIGNTKQRAFKQAKKDIDMQISTLKGERLVK